MVLISKVLPRILTLFWFVWIYGFADSDLRFEYTPAVRVLGDAEGVVAENPRLIKQSSDGYVWIGTYEGLIRYDGVSSFMISSYEFPEMEHHNIDRIHETSDGAVWFGGGGPGIYRMHNGKFNAWGNEDGFDLEIVRAITSDNQGRVYAASLKKILIIEEGVVREHPFDLSTLNTQISDIEIDHADRLWLGTNHGIHIVEQDGRILSPFPELDDQRIEDVLALGNGEVWITTFNGLVCRIREGVATEMLRGVIGEHSAVLAVDPAGGLWVSGRSGVFYYDGERLESVENSVFRSMPDIQISMIDHEGSLWVITPDLKLSQIILPKFQYYAGYDGLMEVPVTGFGSIEGVFYASTFDGVYEFNGSEWTPLSGEINSSVQRMDRMLTNDLDGNLWVCSQRQGIVRFNPKTGETTFFTTEVDLPNNEVRNVTCISDGSVWIGTENGVFRYKDGLMERIFSIPYTKVISITETPDGSIWCGIYGEGIYRLQDEDVSVFSRKDGLGSNVPFHVLQIGDEDFLVSTNAGLSRIQGGTVSTIKTADGLPADSVFYVVNDEHGYSWFVTNPGFYRVKSAVVIAAFEKKGAVSGVDFYDASDGIPFSDMMAPTKPWIHPDSGKIWMASTKGIIEVDPDHIPEDISAPKALIESVEMDDQTLHWGDLLKQPMQIPSHVKHIRFRYNAPSFFYPKKVRFKVRLKGYDSGWIETSDRTISYANLKSGDYEFEVMACSSDDVWTETPTTLTFEKIPGFYETLWFKLLLGVCILIFAAVVSLVYNHQLGVRKRLLERIVAERTDALKEALIKEENANRAKTNFLAMMSHEIRTPMNGVIGMLDILLDGRLQNEEREQALSAKQCAGSLMSILNDILDLAKIESDNLVFEEIPFELVNIAREAVVILETNAREKGIRFDVNFADVEHVFLIGDPLRLRQVVLNILSNAIKFTDEGTIRISCDLLEKTDVDTSFAIVIQDTGIGISEQNLSRIFSSFDQGDVSYKRKYGGSGLGLSICKRIVEELGGCITCESKVNHGSTFKILLKLPNARVQGDSLKADKYQPDAANKGVLNILLAEDIQFNQKIIVHLVKKMGHHITAVWDGKQALDALKLNHYDVVLMDVSMPEMDGLETTSLIRKGHGGIDPNIPIVALTANAMQGDRDLFLQCGMNAYLSKPIDRDLLEKLLDQYAMLSEIRGE